MGGTIKQPTLERMCAEILGMETFDEDAFLERVDFINVPAREVLEFHMKDGRVVTKACPVQGGKK